jgi:L-threonylcarbamoyladenylate synthase
MNTDKSTLYINKAAKIIKEGGIVIYPTDTAFGIGCRMDDEASVARLFSIRKRPKTQAVPLLCSSMNMVNKYIKTIPVGVDEKLIKKYWPGPLTIVFEAKVERIPELVRGGKRTIGMRVPNHKDVISLIRKVGIPILGPSANFHGEATPYTFSEIDPKLIYLVDYVMPGLCELKKASTVVDVSLSPWMTLREGAIKLR